MKRRCSIASIVGYVFLVLTTPCLSVAQEMETEIADSVEHYLHRAAQLKITAPYQAIQLSTRALKLAQASAAPRQVAEARYQICTTLNGSIPYDSLQTICEEAMGYFADNGDGLKAARIRNHLGIVHDVVGNDEEAVQYFERAIEQFENLQACEDLANTYNNLGVVFLSSKQNQKARGYYFRALKVNEECPNERNEMISYHNIGAQFMRKSDLALAQDYLHRAEEIARKTNDQFWMASIFLRLSSLYRNKGNSARAQKYTEEALAIAMNNKDGYSIPYCFKRLALIHKNNEEFDIAIEYYEKAANELTRRNQKKGLAAIYNNLAECHILLKQYRQAADYLDIASTFENRGWAGIAKTYKQYALLHEKTGNLYHSIEYYKKHIAARDSAFSRQLKSNIKQLEQNFLLEQQKTDFENLNERYQFQNWLVAGLFIAALLLAGSLAAYFQFYQDKKRHNQELESKVRERTASLEKSNEELQKFAFIASHDLKSPLRNIYGFLSLIKRRCSRGMDPEEGMQFINHALEATKRMHTLIEDVLEYSRMEYLEAKVEPVQLDDLIEDVITDLRNDAAYPGAKIITEGDFPIVRGNPVLFKQLFTNLIDNGLKYNESQQKQIVISGKQTNETLILSVADNGIGIQEEYRKKVFGIFKRLHNSEEYDGTGIGLAICKKIADYYQGEIKITDNSPQGTIFQLLLPAELTTSKPVPDKAPVSLLQ